MCHIISSIAVVVEAQDFELSQSQYRGYVLSFLLPLVSSSLCNFDDCQIRT